MLRAVEINRRWVGKVELSWTDVVFARSRVSVSAYHSSGWEPTSPLLQVLFSLHLQLLNTTLVILIRSTLLHGYDTIFLRLSGYTLIPRKGQRKLLTM